MAAIGQTRALGVTFIFILSVVPSLVLLETIPKQRSLQHAFKLLIVQSRGSHPTDGHYSGLEASSASPTISSTSLRSMRQNDHPEQVKSAGQRTLREFAPERSKSQLRDGGDDGGNYYNAPFMMNPMLMQQLIYNKAKAAAAVARVHQTRGTSTTSSPGSVPKPPQQHQARTTTRSTVGRGNRPGPRPAVAAMIMSMMPYPNYGDGD